VLVGLAAAAAIACSHSTASAHAGRPALQRIEGERDSARLVIEARNDLAHR
jgi:hypothetical protein